MRFGTYIDLNGYRYFVRHVSVCMMADRHEVSLELVSVLRLDEPEQARPVAPLQLAEATT